MCVSYTCARSFKVSGRYGTACCSCCRRTTTNAAVALKIALDVWREKLIAEEDAVVQVRPRHLDQLLHPSCVNEKGTEGRDVGRLAGVSGLGHGHCPLGKIMFTATDAEAWFARGKRRTGARGDVARGCG